MAIRPPSYPYGGSARRRSDRDEHTWPSLVADLARRHRRSRWHLAKRCSSARSSSPARPLKNGSVTVRGQPSCARRTGRATPARMKLRSHLSSCPDRRAARRAASCRFPARGETRGCDGAAFRSARSQRLFARRHRRQFGAQRLHASRRFNRRHLPATDNGLSVPRSIERRQ